jgi:peptidyl-prolyl cis-trans isomerase SurA
MQRFFLLTVLCCFIFPLRAGGETVSQVAAVVNDEIITTYQLERELQQIDAAAGEGKKSQVLDKMIEKLLLQQRIKELGLKISEEELDAAILDVQKQNKFTRAQLEDALRQQGLSFAEYQENLRGQILQFKLLAREVQSKVEVTNQEVRDYFRDHIDTFRLPPSLRLSRLTFPLPEKAGEEKVAAVRRQAEAARERLLQGEDVTIVQAESDAEGGDMGVVRKEDLTAAFARAVLELGAGEVSPVIETPPGFHVLLVTERQEGQIRHFDSVKNEITKILGEKKSEAGLKKWAEELRKNANIEIRL